MLCKVVVQCAGGVAVLGCVSSVQVISLHNNIELFFI